MNMATSFNPEAAQDHVLEDVKACVQLDGRMTEVNLLILQLSMTAAEIKIEILRIVSNGVQRDPNNYDLVYTDDNQRKLIPDFDTLLPFEELLAGVNSHLEVVSRVMVPEQPKQCPQMFGLKLK